MQQTKFNNFPVMYSATGIIIAIFVSVFIHCTYPVDPEDRDLVEIDRIWQYCKIFSIYSGRVPSREDAYAYHNPQLLVQSIMDTMHSPVEQKKWFVGQYYPDYKVLEKMLQGCLPTISTNSKTRRNGTVFFEMVSDNIAYVRIRSFGYYTYDEFIAIDASLDSVPYVILDLRDNPGGIIDVASYLVSEFLPENAPYLKVTYRKNFFETHDTGTVVHEVWNAKTPVAVTHNKWKNKTIALLINNGTASAAEIVTAGLKEGMSAQSVITVGQNSYGKGIGQYVFLFKKTSKSGLKITGMHFYTLSGDDYHEKGIVPDTVVTTNSPDSVITIAASLLDSASVSKDHTVFSKIAADDSTMYPDSRPLAVPYRGSYKIIIEK